MEDRLEPLRLFDPRLPLPNRSGIETAQRLSEIETTPSLSEIETDSPGAGDRDDELHLIAQTAILVVSANRRLDAAIEAARLAGCTWRQIGTAAGVPYQTLHRRHRQGGANDFAP